MPPPFIFYVVRQLLSNQSVCLCHNKYMTTYLAGLSNAWQYFKTLQPSKFADYFCNRLYTGCDAAAEFLLRK